MNKYKGFTLIELMITVAIMSILLTVGLPSFQSIITDSRLTATANAMLSAYQLARFEAIKQHKDVYVTTADSWATWQVTVKDATAPLATFEKSTNIDITKAGLVSGYIANGTPAPQNVSCGIGNSTPPTCGFTFKNADGSNTRTLNITSTGRTKVTSP
ncbi:MAG: GspH/FimT family pseudopilin [Methylococcales bacterium]|nr:GspH/FimT family pseudopilin [Methylococcales bacterium]